MRDVSEDIIYHLVTPCMEHRYWSTFDDDLHLPWAIGQLAKMWYEPQWIDGYW